MIQNRIITECYAKINLFLEITEKREDGYHNIDSVMQRVTLSDKISMSIEEGSGIILSCNNRAVPLDGTNIAYRAALFYLGESGLDKKITIDIEKNIPVAAGLAGGSANAAAVLCVLQSELGALSEKQLLDVARKLGADVPFCLVGKCAKCVGIGDSMSEIKSGLSGLSTVIAIGNESVSTKGAYAVIDANARELRSSLDTVAAIEAGDVNKLCGSLYNAFESIVLPKCPMAENALSFMRSNGAIGAMMSGSGPSVFGIYENETQSQRVCSGLEKLGYRAFCCRFC